MIFKLATYKDRKSRRLDPALDDGETNVEGQKDESALGNEPRSASVVTEAAMIWTSLIIANVLLLGIHIGLLLTSRCSAPAKRNAVMGEVSNWCKPNSWIENSALSDPLYGCQRPSLTKSTSLYARR